MGIGKKKGWFKKKGGGFDTDAQAFINAAGISDSTQQNAINTLVIGLKADSIWTKMKAIYPFVGGTADTHKYNLVDPQDTDGAFRLDFNGTWVHSSTGAKPDGLTATADTHLVSSDILSKDDKHLSYYSRTNFTGNGGGDIGSSVTVQTGFDGMNLNFNGRFYVYLSRSSSNGFNYGSSLGFFSGSRTGATVYYRTPTSTFSDSTYISHTAQQNTSIIIGGYHAVFSTRECSFATIGDGLTETETGNLQTLVEAFQTTLNRQV